MLSSERKTQKKSTKKEKVKNKTDSFPVCRAAYLAHQCPVNYWPAKQKRGERFGGEHHLSLDISPKPVVNEVDNCLVILLARAHSIGGIQGRLCTAIKLFSSRWALHLPLGLIRKPPESTTPLSSSQASCWPENAHRSVNAKWQPSHRLCNSEYKIHN